MPFAILSEDFCTLFVTSKLHLLNLVAAALNHLHTLLTPSTYHKLLNGSQYQRNSIGALDVLLYIVVPCQSLDKFERLPDDLLFQVRVHQEVKDAFEAPLIHHGLAVLIADG